MLYRTCELARRLGGIAADIKGVRAEPAPAINPVCENTTCKMPLPGWITAMR